MSPDEREETMHGFYKGSIDILVATTVVEVGVHVPNATMMVIEHPERFGLAQLHQLRGRVGRGTDQGLCAMIMSDKLAENSEARLKCLVETNDGFEIAQRDLELRGHGELTGLRQSGIGELDLSDVISHQELLLEAKRCAQDLIGADPCLAHPDNLYLRMIIESVSGVTLDR
jgi:ATP-dependent DNA helicase RecG